MTEDDRESTPMQSCSDSCWGCAVRSQGLFAHSSKESLDRWDLHRHSLRFTRGSVIFRQGNLPTGIHCIREGRVRLFKTCSRGNIQILGWAGAGDLLGETAVYADVPHGSTAEAATDVEVCFFQAAAIRNIVEHDVRVAEQLVRKLSFDLINFEDRLLTLVHRSVKERLAKFLLTQADEPFQVSRREVAQLLGTTPETLARVLTEFHKAGLIDRSRNRLKILLPEQLRAIAHG